MKKRDVLMWIGIGYLVFLILFAIFGPNFRYNYLHPVAAPSLTGSAEHWLGTDEIGRDVLTRLAFGARISLTVGLIVQSLSIAVGVLVGVTGIYAPKWISNPLMRFTDGMFAFPDILLAILIVGVVSAKSMGVFGTLLDPIGGATILPVIVALSITAWPSNARLVKTQVATLKDREFVIAAQASGASKAYLVRKHIMPQLWGILLAVSMVDLSGTILAESTLSFLGIGVQPPTPSWGTMINNARLDMNSHPYQLVWPCLLLSLTIFALNFVGDGLRAWVDPKG